MELVDTIPFQIKFRFDVFVNFHKDEGRSRDCRGREGHAVEVVLHGRQDFTLLMDE